MQFVRLASGPLTPDPSPRGGEGNRKKEKPQLSPQEPGEIASVAAFLVTSSVKKHAREPGIRRPVRQFVHQSNNINAARAGFAT
jgi:hypothetical protein